jgi:hypothetical protein
VSLTVEDVVVRRASVGAVIVLAGASLSARGVVIDETQPTSVGTFGRGVEVDDGASAALMRVVVRRSSDTAVHVGGPGTRFMATDLAVRETFEENGRGGRGLNVQLGATGVIEGAAIEESHEVGVYVGADAAELEATHLVIRDTHAQSRDGQKGDGMIVELGAHARVSSILIERSDEIGILVWDPGTTLEIVDGVVRDTLGVTSPEGSGIGLAQFRESSVRGTRLLVERAGVIGIAALEGSQGEFEDVTVRDISADETTGAFGRGMDTSRSTLRVARALIERTHEVGVMVLGEGATLDAEDIVVRDTDSTPIGGALGISCVVQLGGAAVVTRAIFERSHTGGVFAIGRGTRTELSDVIIRGVSRPPCAEASTCELPVAIGLSSNDGASLTTSRFEVTNAGDCGVQVTEDAGLDLRDGVIAANSIGACVQQDGYDLSRLSTNVRYSDNGTSLDATMLPIPMPLDATSTP